MAAIAKRLLHFRPYSHSYARPNPYPLRHFSSSFDPDSRPDVPQSDSTPAPSAQERPFLSGSSGLRDTLESPQQNRRTPPPSGASSTDEIHRRLPEFRMRSAISLQEIYEKCVNSEGKDSANPNFGGVRRPMDAIRSSMLQPNIEGKSSDFLSRLAGNLRQKADQDSSKEGFFLSSYRAFEQRELGKKLKELRPVNRKGRWFSLQELSDRLAKVKEAEKKVMGLKMLEQRYNKKLQSDVNCEH